MYDALSLRGIFRVFTHQEDHVLSPAEADAALREGRAALDHEDHNLIVNNGLAAIAKFLGGAVGAPLVGGLGVTDIRQLAITRMELGNAPTPPIPVITDTTSVGNLVYVPQILVYYVTPYAVRISGIVRHNELNGTTFTEEALKMANGLVFAKATGFSVLKVPSAAKQFDHTITMDRA